MRTRVCVTRFFKDTLDITVGVLDVYDGQRFSRYEKWGFPEDPGYLYSIILN